MIDTKLKIIIESLTSNALGDVRRASSGGSKMGAFILCSCLIDALAGFIKGADTNHQDYKYVVRTYLPKYDPRKLYTDLRCKLVHTYSEGGSYLFVDAKPHMHLTQQGGKTVINLEDFIFDIEKALQRFQREILDPANTIIRDRAIARLDSNGIIQVFHLDNLFGSPPVSGTDI